jgi:hypothetical protein
LTRYRLDTGLAPATVHKMHVVLHKALAQAVSDGLVPRNVVKGLKVSQNRSGEIRALNAEQVRCLLDAARDDRLEALYVLALNTGMRQGEDLVYGLPRTPFLGTSVNKGKKKGRDLGLRDGSLAALYDLEVIQVSLLEQGYKPGSVEDHRH